MSLKYLNIPFRQHGQPAAIELFSCNRGPTASNAYQFHFFFWYACFFMQA
jgi:hypothetical protein